MNGTMEAKLKISIRLSTHHGAPSVEWSTLKVLQERNFLPTEDTLSPFCYTAMRTTVYLYALLLLVVLANAVEAVRRRQSTRSVKPKGASFKRQQNPHFRHLQKNDGDRQEEGDGRNQDDTPEKNKNSGNKPTRTTQEPTPFPVIAPVPIASSMPSSVRGVTTVSPTTSGDRHEKDNESGNTDNKNNDKMNGGNGSNNKNNDKNSFTFQPTPGGVTVPVVAPTIQPIGGVTVPLTSAPTTSAPVWVAPHPNTIAPIVPKPPVAPVPISLAPLPTGAPSRTFAPSDGSFVVVPGAPSSAGTPPTGTGEETPPTAVEGTSPTAIEEVPPTAVVRPSPPDDTKETPPSAAPTPLLIFTRHHVALQNFTASIVTAANSDVSNQRLVSGLQHYLETSLLLDNAKVISTEVTLWGTERLPATASSNGTRVLYSFGGNLQLSEPVEKTIVHAEQKALLSEEQSLFKVTKLVQEALDDPTATVLDVSMIRGDRSGIAAVGQEQESDPNNPAASMTATTVLLGAVLSVLVVGIVMAMVLVRHRYVRSDNTSAEV